MSKRLDPKTIKAQLESLITRAESCDVGLANRLGDLKRWIGKKKEGLLTRKALVLDFLTEVIIDANIYLKLQAANDRQRSVI